jgi:hypothetical protein
MAWHPFVQINDGAASKASKIAIAPQGSLDSQLCTYSVADHHFGTIMPMHSAQPSLSAWIDTLYKSPVEVPDDNLLG